MSAAFADMKTVRAALFDVLDANEELGWMNEGFMPGWTEDNANLQRTLFVDAVIARITELQLIPGESISLENLCPRHKVDALPKPTVQVCVQCEKERKQCTV